MNDPAAELMRPWPARVARLTLPKHVTEDRGDGMDCKPIIQNMVVPSMCWIRDSKPQDVGSTVPIHEY